MANPVKNRGRVLSRQDSKPVYEPFLMGPRTPQLDWNFGDIVIVKGESYLCGFCGNRVAPSKGSFSHGAKILVCHNCSRPTFIDVDGRQYPEAAFGNYVSVADASIEGIYSEARKAISAGANTAAVLCCRKLLMHIAVERGAQAGQSFQSYVSFLSKNNHVPAACQDWVDQIRKLGNEANHEIILATREDAEQLLQFSEMLLKILYEYPARAAERNGRDKTE